MMIFKALSIALLIATLVVIAWVAWTFVHAWMTEKGSFIDRTLAAGKDSATIVWSKLVIIAGAMVAVLDKASQLFGDGSLTAQIQQYLTPQIVGYVMVGVMAINVWARVRTLGK
jgi:hypothetical protein